MDQRPPVLACCSRSSSLCVSPQFEAVDSGPILVIEWCPGAGAVSVNGLKPSQTRVKHGLVSRMTVPGDQRTQGVPKGDSVTGSDHGRIRCHPLFFGPVDTMSIWKWSKWARRLSMKTACSPLIWHGAWYQESHKISGSDLVVWQWLINLTNCHFGN